MINVACKGSFFGQFAFTVLVDVHFITSKLHGYLILESASSKLACLLYNDQKLRDGNISLRNYGHLEAAIETRSRALFSLLASERKVSGKDFGDATTTATGWLACIVATLSIQ